MHSNKYLLPVITSWLEVCNDLNWLSFGCVDTLWLGTVGKACVTIGLGIVVWVGDDVGGPRVLTIAWVVATNAGFKSGGLSNTCNETPRKISSLGGPMEKNVIRNSQIFKN